ncbi:MAG: SPOR domain-containing protein, partial [Pseudomonadota bacterium]|nr:SPOR domain-containing protein [Pseudomonadota bacterium]
LTGILIGLVLGVGISAGVAVWVARMPNPFQNRALEGVPQGPVVQPLAPAPAAGRAGSAGGSAAQSGGTTPQDGATGGGNAGDVPAAGSAANPALAPAASKTPTAGDGSGDAGTASAQSAGKALEQGSVTLQVGAFANEDDALRQVETIAQVSGARAKVVPPPDKSEHPLYRVRVGPVQRGADLTELVEALKANGISSTVVRAPGADASR